jgi:hypothetical protein
MATDKAKLQLYLPNDLKKDLKIHCLIEGASMSEWVEAAIREKLERENYKELYEDYKRERGIGHYGEPKRTEK